MMLAKAVASAVGLVLLASVHGECRGDDQCAAEASSMLQLNHRWDWASCTTWMSSAVQCLNASTLVLTTKLPHIVEFYDDADEGFEGIFIEDGNNDMFDDGNYLAVRAWGFGYSKALNYTQQCDGGWTDSGVADVEYWTCRVDKNNATVWYAGFRSQTGLVDGLVVSGELGSDGEGFIRTGSAGNTQYMAKRNLHGYYSQTLETTDASINHLIVVPDSAWAIGPLGGTDPANENDDLKFESMLTAPLKLVAGKPVHALLYVLWGGSDDENEGDATYQYSAEEFHKALEAVTTRC